MLTVTSATDDYLAWRTAISTPDGYFSDSSNPDPQFILTLDDVYELDSLVVWGHHNVNEATNFTLELSTDRGATWTSVSIVFTSRFLGVPHGQTGQANAERLNLSFTGSHLANRVRLTVWGNAKSRGLGSGAGGDRVGLNEVRFIGRDATSKAPLNLTATAIGPKRIDLAWVKPPAIPYSSITSYKVERATSGTGPWTVLSNSHTFGRIYRDEDKGDQDEPHPMTANTTYHYRVSARVIGDKGWPYPLRLPMADGSLGTEDAPLQIDTLMDATTTVGPSSTASATTKAAGAAGVVPQLPPNPVVIDQDAERDVITYLGSAGEHPDTMAVVEWASPKFSWVPFTSGSGEKYIQWRVQTQRSAEFRVKMRGGWASGGSNATLALSVNGTERLTATWETWQSYKHLGNVTLPAGVNTLTLERKSGGYPTVFALELMEQADYSGYLARVEQARASTRNFGGYRVGFFFQYGAWGFPRTGSWADKKSVDDQARDFDVDAFVDRMQQVGAGVRGLVDQLVDVSDECADYIGGRDSGPRWRHLGARPDRGRCPGAEGGGDRVLPVLPHGSGRSSSLR